MYHSCSPCLEDFIVLVAFKSPVTVHANFLMGLLYSLLKAATIHIVSAHFLKHAFLPHNITLHY